MGLFILLMLLVIIVAWLIFSTKYSKIGGIISVIGFVSLCITSCKFLRIQVELELTGIGFPASLEKMDEISQIKESLTSEMNTMLPWIVASAMILLTGILWLIADVLKSRKHTQMC